MPQPCYTKEEDDWAKNRGLDEKIMFPQAQQWKVIMALHETTHYGCEALWNLLQRLFAG